MKNKNKERKLGSLDRFGSLKEMVIRLGTRKIIKIMKKNIQR